MRRIGNRLIYRKKQMSREQFIRGESVFNEPEEVTYDTDLFRWDNLSADRPFENESPYDPDTARAFCHGDASHCDQGVLRGVPRLPWSHDAD